MSGSENHQVRDPYRLTLPERRFTVRDVEWIGLLGVIWAGAFALNWWHVIP